MPLAQGAKSKEKSDVKRASKAQANSPDGRGGNDDCDKSLFHRLCHSIVMETPVDAFVLRKQNTTVGETGPEEPVLSTVPGARRRCYGSYPHSPIRVSGSVLHYRPDRWQHPTTWHIFQKPLATEGASTDG